MEKIIVDVASYNFGSNGQHLEAPSLGAAVGVGVYDERAKIGGIYAFMFPDSTQAAVDPRDYPLMFADTGLDRFVSAAREKGIALDRSKIAICGGAQFLDAVGGFNLGGKNCAAVKKWLSRAALNPGVLSLGGIYNRSLELNLKLGKLRVTCSARGATDEL